MNPALLWTIKVACVVIGQCRAVIAAHDQALRVIPVGHQLSGQLAMMLVMVAYTLTGFCTCCSAGKADHPAGPRTENGECEDEPRPAAQCAARRPFRGPARRGGRDAQL